MKISAFPKCYIDQIAGDRTMSVFDWIKQARSLDADGLEMYDGFFTSLEPAYLDQVRDAISSAGFAMPMLCCSPDFTNPDADARKRAVDRQATLITVAKRLGGSRARFAGFFPASAIQKSIENRGWNGSPIASISRWPSRVSTTSFWGSRTTTRTASGSIPNSLRRWMSSSSCWR